MARDSIEAGKAGNAGFEKNLQNLLKFLQNLHRNLQTASDSMEQGVTNLIFTVIAKKIHFK